MTKQLTNCAYANCGARFEVNVRGRRRRYCGTHRQNAYQQRRIAELKQPSERRYRLLVEDLKRLSRLRSTRLILPGFLSPSHKRIRARVVDLLNEIAPEVLWRPSDATDIARDLNQAVVRLLETGDLQRTRTERSVTRRIQSQLREIAKPPPPDASK
jgi:hypothetical protein